MLQNVPGRSVQLFILVCRVFAFSSAWSWKTVVVTTVKG